MSALISASTISFALADSAPTRMPSNQNEVCERQMLGVRGRGREKERDGHTQGKGGVQLAEGCHTVG